MWNIVELTYNSNSLVSVFISYKIINKYKQIKKNHHRRLVILSKNSIISFQLYEIDDNPKRKEFLDELFTMMQKRGKPRN